jgi:multidrug transporter EmrE-like cation transporter
MTELAGLLIAILGEIAVIGVLQSPIDLQMFPFVMLGIAVALSPLVHAPDLGSLPARVAYVSWAGLGSILAVLLGAGILGHAPSTPMVLWLGLVVSLLASQR